MVHKAGKVTLVGGSKGYLNLEDADEAIFLTMYISPVEYPLAVELITAKIVGVKGLVTQRFRLANFEKVLRTVQGPKKRELKVIIKE